MKDPRGIERGGCKNCECTEYALDPGATRAACSYCDCPAPAHTQVSTSVVLDSIGSPSTSNAAAPIATSTPGNPVILEVSNNADDFLQALLSSNNNDSNIDGPNTDEIFMPPKLFPKHEKAIKERDVSATIKSDITRLVYANLFGHNQTDNRCLKKAAKKMTIRWSPLKDPTDPENVGLTSMLRNRRDRTMSDDSGSASTSSSVSFDAMTAHEAKKSMLGLWTNGTRTAAAHQALMETARPLRRLEVKKLPGLNLFRAYPALGINDILLHEFLVEMEITLEFCTERWKKVLGPLKEHFKEKDVVCVDGTMDEETLSILQGLHLVSSIWYKERNKNNVTAKVLVMYPDDTPPEEAQPGAREPPRLIGIGSHQAGSLSFSCYVDSEPAFVEDSAFRALLLLLALFFVAKVKWPPLTRLPLTFLTVAIAGVKHVRKDVIKNQKLVDLLKKFNIYN